ncbi:hypothetical protein Pmani_003160 [Petrolisthes manimaculis]|uniref:Uncharacterized protein n=1 Tax=Petrolisthes manimaculis TaxID=1843537 RepID=A0AAE1QGD2_9EUCA|nr:hypothetical protein Pmani_003160 [Petrolisthes manimaculis]
MPLSSSSSLRHFLGTANIRLGCGIHRRYIGGVIVTLSAPATSEGVLWQLKAIQRQGVSLHVHTGRSQHGLPRTQHDGIIPLPKKVEAIRKFPLTDSTRKLREFFGVVNTTTISCHMQQLP